MKPLCPICHKPSSDEARPFCSRRCADVDLGKWFSGSYTLASSEPLDEASLEAVIEAHEDAPQ